MIPASILSEGRTLLPTFPVRAMVCAVSALRAIVCHAIMTTPGGAGTPRKAHLQLFHVLGAPISLIGSELSSLLGSDLSFVPIVHGIIYGETLGPVQTPAKVTTWHTKIRHLAYVLSPSSVLQSDQSSSRVPSESPLPERPGFSLASAGGPRSYGPWLIRSSHTSRWPSCP